MLGGVESKELQQLHLRAREQLHVATWKKEDGMPRVEIKEVKSVLKGGWWESVVDPLLNPPDR